jgi:molybdopterin molybdotransferase
VLVHGLAVKPGKPVVIGLVGEVPVFGLPGHPTSCLVMFRQLVAPLIRRATDPHGDRSKPIRALLTRNCRSQAGREDLVPVVLEQREGRWTASPVLRPSSLISGLLGATGLVRVPTSAEGLYEGDEVDVEVFE